MRKSMQLKYQLKLQRVALLIRNLLSFKKAYPEFIESVTDEEMIWRDGTKMPIDDKIPNKTQQETLDNPSLLDVIRGPAYVAGTPSDKVSFQPTEDPGRIRYLPLFKKMYGQSEAEVKSKVVTIYWMPKFFADKYPLEVSTVNGVNQKLLLVSAQLEQLVAIHPEYLGYLEDPGGTFCWRVIANTNRLSAHCFGMTVDINSMQSDYWQWDLKKEGHKINQETNENQPLNYRNHVP